MLLTERWFRIFWPISRLRIIVSNKSRKNRASSTMHKQNHYQFMRYFITMLVLALCCQCQRDDTPTPATKPTQTSSKKWFTEITADVGLDFLHESGANGKLLMQELLGSGVALFDYDNDGDLDIYLTTGHSGLPNPESADAPPNRLLNQKADGHFVDVSLTSGLDDRGYGMGVAIGDIDNDGDTDVYVTNYGLDKLFRNRGDGTFENITKSSGIKVEKWSASATFLDYDRDGFLDLFVTQYLIDDPTKVCIDRSGRRNYCGPNHGKPIPDVLLHNNQDGTFTDASEKSGITSVSAAGLGVICEDFNEDGWIDIYVANDAFANNLWINQQDGTFSDDALLLGCSLNLHGHAEGSMGIIAADFDNDTDVDLFMTHLNEESNTFYVNQGNQLGFIDMTIGSGLGWSSVGLTGFGTVAFDVEHDGDLDIAVVNGRVMFSDPVSGVTMNPPWDKIAEPNLFYINDGNGKFLAADDRAEVFCKPIEITRGLAVGDIDKDGDLDMLITNIEGPARLYRNDAPQNQHWLMIRAIDPRMKRDAIGARVLVHFDHRSLTRTITSGFSYISASEPVAHFGLGKVNKIDHIEIFWPDGYREKFMVSVVDQALRLKRGTGKQIP